MEKDLKNNIEEFLLDMKMQEKSKNTIEHYRYVINLFVDSLGNREPTKNDVIQFKSELIDKFKPKTVTNYLTIVNKFLKYCDLEDLTVKNIKIQQKSNLEEVLEPIDLKRLLRMAKQTNQMDLYYIMKIIAFTGIRIDELKIFTVENIKSNYITVSNKGKIRDVIIRQDLRRELVRYCRENNIKSGYIFPGKKKGTMIHKTTIFKRMKKLAGKCRGISKSKVHAHSFRHLFAVKYIEQGGDVTEVADILGHSSIETTRIYTRTTVKMKRDKMERMKY